MIFIHQKQVACLRIPLELGQHRLIHILLPEPGMWELNNRCSLRRPSVNSASACHNIEVVGAWREFKTLDWVQMNKHTCELKSCHVPNPDGRGHLIALWCHVVGSVTPADFLDTCWRPLDTHVFILWVLECLQLFLGNLWDLDDLLLTFSLVG